MQRKTFKFSNKVTKKEVSEQFPLRFIPDMFIGAHDM